MLIQYAQIIYYLKNKKMNENIHCVVNYLEMVYDNEQNISKDDTNDW